MKQYLNPKKWHELTKEEQGNVNEVLLTVQHDNMGRKGSTLYHVVEETDTDIINQWYIEVMEDISVTKILVKSDWSEVIDYKQFTLGSY